MGQLEIHSQEKNRWMDRWPVKQYENIMCVSAAVAVVETHKNRIEPPETMRQKLLVVWSSNILNKSLFHWQDNEFTHSDGVESRPKTMEALSEGRRIRHAGQYTSGGGGRGAGCRIKQAALAQ